MKCNLVWLPVLALLCCFNGLGAAQEKLPALSTEDAKFLDGLLKGAEKGSFYFS